MPSSPRVGSKTTPGPGASEIGLLISEMMSRVRVLNGLFISEMRRKGEPYKSTSIASSAREED